jgi:hypothetical protein
MPCFEFLEGLVGQTGNAPPKTKVELKNKLEAEKAEKTQLDQILSAGSLLPVDLVEEIISFVPPIVQEAQYKKEIAAPRGIDVSLLGKYCVTFEGDVCVGGRANVHLCVTDQRTDGRTKFPTFDFKWVTEVIDITDQGVLLARGDEEDSYIIKQRVVNGRLLKTLDDSCVPSSFFSTKSQMSGKPLKRCNSF